MRAREHLARASELRRRIREADDTVSEIELRHLCDDARFETDNVRLLGDLALAAFFEGSKPKQREDVRRAMVPLAFLPSNLIYGHTLNIYPLQTNAAFCALQYRPHEIWARFLGSSMKDDLRYTPSDCFESFPFPDGWNTHPDLERIGADYYRVRADLMVRHDEGLTKTYNRFHDPDESGPAIADLRDLHTAMDRAVLDTYGWTDIPTDCEFVLDHEIDEEDWGTRKKPYRYRWPNEVRNEVLARLLELNAERAATEEMLGTESTAKEHPDIRRRPRSSEGPEAATVQSSLWNATED